MSRKTIIIAAAALVVILIAAAVGYRSLSARQQKEGSAAVSEEKSIPETAEEQNAKEELSKSSGSEAGETVPFAEEKEDSDAQESETAGSDSSSADLPEQELPAAPDFTVQTLDGEETSLSDLAGTPVIVNFWATWCPPCQAELPHFQEACKNYGDQISFMMVDLMDGVRETRADLDAFLLKNGYTFPVYADVTGNAANTYSIYSIPMTVAVDADGTLKAQRIGSLTQQDLQEIIDLLLS